MTTTNDYENLSPEELADTLNGLKVTALQAATYLSVLCGDADEARRRIRLALNLPPTVLARAYDRAHSVIAAGGELSIDETAAWIACGYNTVQLVAAMLERKQAQASVQ